jgi:hypothetical protein
MDTRLRSPHARDVLPSPPRWRPVYGGSFDGCQLEEPLLRAALWYGGESPWRDSAAGPIAEADFP